MSSSISSSSLLGLPARFGEGLILLLLLACLAAMLCSPFLLDVSTDDLATIGGLFDLRGDEPAIPNERRGTKDLVADIVVSLVTSFAGVAS